MPKEQPTVPDNCQLVELTSASVLSNLRRRYLQDDIYVRAPTTRACPNTLLSSASFAQTFTGSILLAINPYASLPIYGSDAMAAFPDKSIGKNAPHVFASAEEAFRCLRKERRSQSLVVSGESGAVKTETNKHLMRYLAWRSRAAGQASVEDLAESVLQSNPVLEAFGNAKTGRNNNSSRFGKFTQIFVDGKSGQVAGAEMSAYLLEKCRVVTQAAEERGYHAVYMLQAGASPAERAEFRLAPSCAGYACVRGSTFSNPGWGDDAAEFATMRAAMGKVGVVSTKQHELLAVVASVLHTGNCTFEQAAGGEHAELRDSAPLATAATLLRTADLSPLVLTRTVTIMSEPVTVQLVPAQAQAAVSALCKALYSLLFEWIVSATNGSIRGRSAPGMSFIGLLDVFGFESFEVNSFEQLCINFANERLHQFFLKYVFKMEEQIYAAECISGVSIEYADNQPTIDLIDKSPMGLFQMLDSTCKMPKATDATFCSSVLEQHSKHPCLVLPKRPQREAEAFTIRHFAACVTYSVGGFLEKNNDSLDSTFKALLLASTNSVAREMVQLAVAREEAAAPPTNANGRGGPKAGPKAAASVSKRFSASLKELTAALEQTTAHFVRCIKPNPRFKPRDVDEGMVDEQLRSNGTLEAVQLMRVGFPTRVPYDVMVDRYKQHLEAVPGVAELTAAQFCEVLAAVAELGSEDYQLGVTKMFLKAGRGKFMEDLKEKPIEEILPVLKQKMIEWERRRRVMGLLLKWLHMMGERWYSLGVNETDRCLHCMRALSVVPVPPMHVLPVLPALSALPALPMLPMLPTLPTLPMLPILSVLPMLPMLPMLPVRPVRPVRLAATDAARPQSIPGRA